MGDPIRVLSDAEVRQISLIIESLDRSTLDFLQLEFGDVKLMIGKGLPPAANAAPSAAASLQTPASAPIDAAPSPAATMTREAPGDEDTVAITAPMLGRFYRQPEPGAPPLVQVGSEVVEDTTIAIIEVMKMFNAIPAGVRGIITAICVENAQFVEYGQVLFRVRPSEAR
jgi:acetyl-CoA carboxylase biotin carboxyl carrier protein